MNSLSSVTRVLSADFKDKNKINQKTWPLSQKQSNAELLNYSLGSSALHKGTWTVRYKEAWLLCLHSDIYK